MGRRVWARGRVRWEAGGGGGGSGGGWGLERFNYYVPGVWTSALSNVCVSAALVDRGTGISFHSGLPKKCVKLKRERERERERE